MRHTRVLICQIDDALPDLMTEVACFDLATPDVALSWLVSSSVGES